MNDNKTPSWPKGLLLIRWAITIASLAWVAQVAYMFPRHWGDTWQRFGAYHDSLVLFLTCGACVFAWAKRLRGFVLLAIASQMVSGFVMLFYVLAEVLMRAGVRVDLAGHRPAHPMWNLAALCAAFIVIAYLAPRYVSANRSTSWPKDLTIVRAHVTIGMVVCAGQLAYMLPMCRFMSLNFDIYELSILLFMMCGVCVYGWRRRVQGFVLLAIVGHLIGGFTTLYYLLLEQSYPVGFHSPPRMIWNLVVVCVTSAVVAYLTSRYVSVRIPTPPEASV